MDLKLFIAELQAIYDKEKSQFPDAGEPQIMIDVFEKEEPSETCQLYAYNGFDKDIVVDRSGDGIYLILNRFK